MKSRTVFCVLLSLIWTSLLGAQPLAPKGLKWEMIPQLSDEFNEGPLDPNKWNNYHPGWRGRTPSHFLKDNVWVKDGLLCLRSDSRIKDMSEVKDPINDVWVNSAAVSSKARIASPGHYYEARMKASNLSMTSSFWFRMGDYSEIDVIEHMGNPTNRKVAIKEYRYGCNTHVYGEKRNQGYSKDNQFFMPTRGRDAFHVFGLWWKDPTTLWFYYNGIKVMEVEPSIPFEENLHMIFDTEVFKWNGLPLIENLNDPKKNTMYVDFVRSFKLVPIKAKDKGTSDIVP